MHGIDKVLDGKLSPEYEQELLRAFLSIVREKDLAKLKAFIDAYAFLSAEHIFLAGFLYLLEIDINAGTVRLGPELREQHPDF